MKKLLGMMIGFLLCVVPLMASTKGYDQLLGVLTPSSVILDLDSYEIETYEVFDMSYVPVFRLKDAGCDVLYDPINAEIKISANPTSTPTCAETPDLSQKPFSLYEGNIWIGNFKTSYSLIPIKICTVSLMKISLPGSLEPKTAKTSLT